MAVVKVDVRFSDNVAELKERIAAGTGAIEVMKQSVDRAAASMGGQGLFLQANRLTAAIDQIGGVTKLTSAEMERHSATLDKAIEKYNVMGMTAPPAMVALAESMRPVQDESDTLGGHFESLKDAIEHPMESAKALASSFAGELSGSLGTFGMVAAGVVAAVGAVGVGLMELGEHATETGAALEKLSLVSGASVAGLSDFRFALDATGGATVDLDRVMFMFQQRMENSSDKVDKGLQLIGLSIGDIVNLAPDQQMLRISKAFQDAGEDVNKSAAAFDIFGKQGREILPSLIQPLTDLAAKSRELGNTWTEVDAEAAHKFEIASKTMATETASAWTQMGRAVAPVTNDLSLGYDRMKLAVANVALTAADGVAKIAEWGDTLEALSLNADTSTAALERLAGELPKVATSTKGLADGSGLAAKGVKDWSDGVKEFTGHATNLDAALENEKEIMRDLDPLTQQRVETMKKSTDTQEKYRATVTGTVQADADQVAVLKSLIPGLVVGEATYIRVRDAIAGMVEKGQQVPEFLKNWSEANRPVLVATKDFSGYLGELTDRSSDAKDSMYTLAASQNEFHDGLTIAGDTISTVTIPLFSTLATGVVPQMSGAIHDATKETASFADELSGSLDQALTAMPNLLVKAFTGGGGLAGATSALGSKFGADMGKSILGGEGEGGVGDFLTNHFGDAVGGALGAAIPAVGALIGPLIGKLFSIGGPSAAEVAGRKTEAAFEQGMGGFQGMMDTVGQAYATAGLSAQQAQSDVKALLDAEKQGTAATQAAIDRINGVIATSTAKVSGAVGGILDAATTVGTNFPAAMQPMIAQLAALPGLTDAEKTSLLGLVHAGEPSFADLSSAAGRYGLTLDTLGGKAGQLSISTEADQIESDYKTLVTDSGANSDKVLAGMKDGLTKLVDHAMDAGAVLPTALQPLVKQLADTGQLTDTAGNKITDLSTLKFDDTGDPLAKGMSSLTDAITNLGNILQGLPNTAKTAADGMGAALGGVKVPTVHVPVVFDRSGDDPTSYAAMGGLVTNHGVAQYFDAGGPVLPFTPRGTDTVPAMLTPGEQVLSRPEAAAYRAGVRRGGGDGGQAAQFSTAALERRIDQLSQALLSESRRAPERTGVAVRDALLQARVGRR